MNEFDSKKQANRNGARPWRSRGGLIQSILLLLSINTAAFANSIMHANETEPGSAINLSSVLDHSQNTLLFIHSPHCGPCKSLEPKIVELASKKSDLRVVDLLLDKPTDSGIGWSSAAAKQFDVHVVPYFIIYSPSGKLLWRGKRARSKVDSWLDKAGIETDD
jgi:thiol-disulfide isomerase/thioredoxin